MSAKKRALYGFVIIGVFLLTVFIFYASSILVLDRVIKSRIQVDELYEKWFLCRGQLISALFTRGDDEKILELQKRINDLDKALKDFEQIPPFSSANRTDSVIGNLILKLRVEWSAARLIFFKEITYLSQFNSISIDQADKVYAELSSSFSPFESVFNSVRIWMDHYYEEQLKSFRLLFILLGLILILSSVFILAATNLNILQEKLFLTALNALSDGVILTDADKRVIFINPGAEKLFNVQSEKVGDETLAEIVTFKSEFSNRSVMLDELENSISSESIVLVNSSGKKIPVSINLTPLFGKRDNRLGYVYLIRDITQWKRLVTKISSEFLALEDIEVDNEIEEILKRIAGAAGAGSAYVFQFETNVESVIETHKWEKKGSKWKRFSRQKKLKIRKDFIELLSSRDFLEWKELNDGDFSSNQGYHWTFAVPLIYAKVLIGFIVVTAEKETALPESTKLSVLTMKDMIVNLLERKWVAEELAVVGSEMNSLIEDANAPIWGVDMDGLITIWNRKMEEISGYSKEDSIENNFIDYLADNNAKSFFYRILDNVHSERTDVDCEIRLKTASGPELVILFNTTLRRNRQGTVSGVIFVGQDITKRKLAEIEIHKLSQQLIRVQEEERRRISMELHDNIAQELLTVRFSLENMLRDNERVKNPGEIKKLSTRVGELIEATRNLSYKLHPAYLEQFGFNKAVELLCNDFTDRYGVSIEYIASGFDRVTIKKETALHLYRIIQEALINMQRHSHAGKAELRIVVSYPDVIIRIEDNGCGFKIDDIPPDAHMGLRNMKERVTLLNGNISILSKPGKGTRIKIEIPLEEQ